ncbi:MCpol domain-containing protein [Vibrio chagasii]|nr:MCpol domain-containing protein [Vibrio chagasii]
MKYIAIDGDDVGRRITSCYLSNDQERLGQISVVLEDATIRIAELLSSKGFDIIFRAADGVVGQIDGHFCVDDLFSEISSVNTSDITFSAGVGGNLREAYIALLSSKSNGKNKISNYSDGL